MKKQLPALLAVCVLLLMIGGMVHIRTLVVQERYAFGELVRVEEQHKIQRVQLRAAWEELNDPAELRSRAQQELNMHPPKASQVLR